MTIEQLTEENKTLRAKIKCLEGNLHLSAEQERFSIEKRQEAQRVLLEVRDVSNILINLANATQYLYDNFQSWGDEFILEESDFNEISSIHNTLEHLPDVPDEDADSIRKAEYIINKYKIEQTLS